MSNTLQHLNLRCHQCGSTELALIGINQFKCQHCSAITLVKDDVSERLDKVLDQVQGAATKRMVLQENLRTDSQKKASKQAFRRAMGFLAVAAVAAVAVAAFIPKAPKPSGDFSEDDSKIKPSELLFTKPRQVQVAADGTLKTALLGMVQNDTGYDLSGSALEVQWFNDKQLLGKSYGKLQRGVLLKGETEPVLFDLPSGQAITRYEFKASGLRTPPAALPKQTIIKMDAVRWYKSAQDIVFAGRVRNSTGHTVGELKVLVNALDAQGQVVAMGSDFFKSASPGPNQSATTRVSLKPVGDLGKAVSLEYVISYSTPNSYGGMSLAVAKDRVVALSQPAQASPAKTDASADELLAP